MSRIESVVVQIAVCYVGSGQGEAMEIHRVELLSLALR
jgi:hypothetical protein